MDKSKKRWLIVLGVVLLIGLILIALVLGWFSRRGKAFDSRPLVLIHEPGYDDYLQVGGGVIIHATATEDNGLARIELWVNDVLVDARDAEDPKLKDMVLFSAWVPTYEGEQQIIVRAISSDDVPGQSSIRINVVAAGGLAATHIVKEGETLESIAEEYGTSPDELEDLNPGLGEGGPAPGDGLFLPDEDPAPEEPSPSPEGEGEPPVFGGEPAMMESTFSMSDLIPSREMPILLRLEIPRLETQVSYDQLHCYLGLADGLPQWYPDRDHNQATDESFEALGGGSWNTEDILRGSAVPLIIWPVDEPLPAMINCVGITGGTESVELGQIDIQILPVWWTGVRRTFEIDGAGGHLEVDVRVSRYNGGSRLIPKTLDPDMEVPSNLNLDEETRSFSWDYSDEGEAGILGFQIFLNDNLLWVEEPFKRESRMPAEWFRPPCETAYTFSVRAYRYDEGDREYYESGTADLSIRPPGDACMRQLQITFLSLETFDLGNDGRYEDRHGDIGPAYGRFVANRMSFRFDQGPEAEGASMPDGLTHNTIYDLRLIAADPDWDSSGSNSVFVDLPEDRNLMIGFMIMDRDNNPDDRICGGVHLALNDAIVNFDEVFTSTIFSDNRQCEVRFEIRPGPDSPVGVAGEGGEPLPWLDFMRHTVIQGRDRGEISLLLKNTGTAGWSEQDLDIGLFTREGEFIKEVTIPDFDLPVGEAVFVTQDDLRLPAPYDFCLHLDLYDEVLELHERTGNLTHTIECPELPDLEIQDAYYQPRGGGRIRIQVQNIGDADIDDRTLTVEVRSLSDNSRLFDNVVLDIDIRSGDMHFYNIPIPSGFHREEMADGYVVNLNPDNGIVESTYTNDYFIVEEATRLSAYLSVLNVPIPASEILRIHIDGYIQNGNFRDRQVVDFDVNGERLDWDCDDAMAECTVIFRDYEHFEPWFDIYGDEDFEIVINIEHSGTRAGGGSLLDNFSFSNLYEPPAWRAGDIDPDTGDCHIDYGRWIGSHEYVVRDWAARRWRLVLDVCLENFSEE